MAVTLRSTGENGAREYEVLAPLVPELDPARGQILYGRRTEPPDLATSVIIKHAAKDQASYEELSERLRDEALEVASTIHPNLTGVADCVEDESGFYLVLEHVDGTDLATAAATLLERRQALSFELIAFICIEVLKAMQHLHTARDAHGKQLLLVVRDVNPSNVLISPTGRVKLANRSLASALEKKRRRSAAQLFAYFAPECIAGEPFSIASDIYGVGVMLWELLVGRPCFPGEAKDEVLAAILKRGVPVQDLHLVKAPSRLASVVERATAFVPERRFQSAIEMARALETFLRDSASESEMPSLFAHFLVAAKLVPGTGRTLDSAGNMVRLLPAVATSDLAMTREEPSIEIVERTPARVPTFLDLPGASSPGFPAATVVMAAAALPSQDVPSGPAGAATSLSDRDRRSIAVRSVRAQERTSMPPAAFLETPIHLEAFEKPPSDVKNRTLLIFLALSIAVLTAILMFIERQEYRLDEMDRANDSHATDQRERYAPGN